MKTRDGDDLLFLYASGALREEEARQVRARCAADPDFAKELELTRAAMRLFGHHRPSAPPPFFWTRLVARLDAEEAARQAWIWAAKRLIPSMVAITLLATAVMWHQARDMNEEAGRFETMLFARDNRAIDDALMDASALSKEGALRSVVLQGGGRQE